MRISTKIRASLAAVAVVGAGVALPASALANTEGAPCPGNADQSCTVYYHGGEGDYQVEFLTQQADGETGTRYVNLSCGSAGGCTTHETADLIDGARTYYVNVIGNGVRDVSAN